MNNNLLVLFDKQLQPYLIQQNYIIRTSRGRQATKKTWQWLGLQPQKPLIGDMFED